MTNLQNNTASLQAILETVNNLPEAGSGSGGDTSIETCTVQMREGALSPSFPTFYYTDINFTPKTLQSLTASFTVPKNTIVAIKDWTPMSTATEGAVQLFYYTTFAAYQITSDCILEYRG